MLSVVVTEEGGCDVLGVPPGMLQAVTVAASATSRTVALWRRPRKGWLMTFSSLLSVVGGGAAVMEAVLSLEWYVTGTMVALLLGRVFVVSELGTPDRFRLVAVGRGLPEGEVAHEVVFGRAVPVPLAGGV
jgi:hypothetical protein